MGARTGGRGRGHGTDREACGVCAACPFPPPPPCEVQRKQAGANFFEEEKMELAVGGL